METIEISFNLDDLSLSVIDLLPYRLELLGFSGFFESDSALLAYIPTDAFDENVFQKILVDFGISQLSIKKTYLPEKNWNELWESSFKPVKIGRYLIRAPFHAPSPENDPEIIIEPKMSFGTGHHATTSLMITEMFRLQLLHAEVLDAGCGTAILSILAEKLGAEHITAVDLDIWSYRNAMENVSLNNCTRIEVLHGDVGLAKTRRFDVILANINLNIHLGYLSLYAETCRKGGSLLISGILSTDIESLNNETKKYGFTFHNSNVLDNWAIVTYIKN